MKIVLLGSLSKSLYYSISNSPWSDSVIFKVLVIVQLFPLVALKTIFLNLCASSVKIVPQI
jgi:hypothetical protein